MLAKIKKFLLDLFFPKECLGCQKEGTYLCQTCLAKISVKQKSYCVFCKQPTKLNNICFNCQSKTALKAVFVVLDYDNQIIQDLLHSFKYKYVKEIALILSKIMFLGLNNQSVFDNYNFNPENSILVPVPLHKKRLLKRGFNQSELLAQELSHYYQVPVVNLLKRQKNTVSQVSLSRQDRIENVKEAFIINPSESILPNKKIILIDDVLTTGSTLNEAALVLAQNGLSEIYGLVIGQRMD